MWISLMLCLLLPVTLLRPKAGLLVVVFLLPFMPRYLGIGIGEEGFALSPRRIAFIAFVSGLVVHAMFRADMLNRARMIVRSNQYFFTLIALVLLVRMVSTIVNATPVCSGRCDYYPGAGRRCAVTGELGGRRASDPCYSVGSAFCIGLYRISRSS